jgi:hypothetical protein
MNLKEIKELIEMLKDTDISEVEIERSGVKVRLRKGGDVTFHPAMPRMEYPDKPDKGHLAYCRHVLSF